MNNRTTESWQHLWPERIWGATFIATSAAAALTDSFVVAGTEHVRLVLVIALAGFAGGLVLLLPDRWFQSRAAMMFRRYVIAFLGQPLLGLLIYLTGGAISPYRPLFVLVIGTSASVYTLSELIPFLVLSLASYILPIFYLGIPQGHHWENVILLIVFLGIAAIISHAATRLRRNIDELETINQTGQEMMSTFEADKASKMLFEKLAASLSIDKAFVLLAEEEDRYLVGRYAFGVDEDIGFIRIPLDDPHSLAAASVRDRLVTQEVNAIGSQTVRQELVKRFGIKSLACIPLIAGKKPLGVVIAAYCGKRRELDHIEIRIATILSQEAGLAIDRGQAYQSQVKTASRFKTLHVLGERITSSLELSAIMQESLQTLEGLIGADVGAVFLLDADGKPRLKYGLGLPKEVFSKVAEGVGQSFSGMAIAKNRTVFCEDLPNDPLYKNPMLEQLGLKTAISLLLRHHNKTIGTLNLGTRKEHHYIGEEVSLLEVCANQIAMAIANANLFLTVKQEKDITETLVQTAADGICMTNSDGYLTTWNPAAERLTGRSKSEAIGRYLWEVVDGKDETGLLMKPKFAALVRKFEVSTKPILEEFDAQVKDSAGRTHWICFSVSASRFHEQVNNIIFTIKEVSVRKQREILYDIDDLTNLYNRHYLRGRLAQEFQRATRYNQSLSCLMFDLDDSKRINDTYDHLAGDLVLKEFAKRLRSGLRTIDTPIRYGGEEFLILLPQTTSSGAYTVGEKVRATMEKEPFLINEERVTVTVSVGGATYDLENPLDATGLIQAADAALLTAKRTGKNKVAFIQKAAA